MGEGYHPSMRHMPYKVEPPRDTSPELREPGYHRKRRRRTNFTQGQVCAFLIFFEKIIYEKCPIRCFWKNIPYYLTDLICKSEVFKHLDAINIRLITVKIRSIYVGLYTSTRYQHRTEYCLAKYRGILVSIFNSMLIGILQNTNPCQTFNTTK